MNATTDAFEIDPTEPYFAVGIESTNEPVDAGDTLKMTANVSNRGVDGSQPVTLIDTDFTDSQQDDTEVDLDRGESNDSITLQWDTGSNDDGTGDVTVATPNESATESVTVEDTGGGGASSDSGETSVTVDDDSDDESDDESDDSESGDDGDSGEPRPDTSVSVSNPQPGQQLVIEGGEARIQDGDDEDSESDDKEGDDESDDTDDGEDDDDGDRDSGGGDSGDGDGESTSNVQADRLSVDINTDRNFDLSISTYEGDLSRSISPEEDSQSSPGLRFASGAAFPQAQTADSEVIAPEEVRAASAAFENETSTVSAGYVDIDHSLEPGKMSGATFEFSIRQSYLEELGVGADEVVLYHRQDGDWETRNTTHVDSDETHHRFEGTMPRFSVFALGTGAEPIGVTDAGLAASTIDHGEEATITAIVANRGQGDAEETVELMVDGETVDSETVSLEGGETTDIEFGYTPKETGEYAFAVGGTNVGSLTVGDDGQSWEWIVATVLVTILVAVLLWRRQTE